MNILSNPHEVALAGNPMRYLIAATGSVGGNKAINIIRVDDVDGDEFHDLKVTFLGEQRTFTLRDSPGDAFEWPIAESGTTISDWADALQAQIERNYYLASNFEITRDNLDIILTAKEEGPSYNFHEDENTTKGIKLLVTGGNVATYAVQGILMQIKTWPANVLIGEDYKPVDSVGHVRFDAAEYIFCRILHDYTEQHFHMQMGSGASPLVFVYSDLVIRYKTTFFEKVNGVFGTGHPDNVQFALAGGLNRESLVREVDNTYDDGMFAQWFWCTRFFTWAPPERKVGAFEPISLYYMLFGANNVETWKIILTTVNSSNVETDTLIKTFLTSTLGHPKNFPRKSH
ncbi:MAG: hypothetical protein WCL00_12710, partial [Bacteroidota bacterium]